MRYRFTVGSTRGINPHFQLVPRYRNHSCVLTRQPECQGTERCLVNCLGGSRRLTIDRSLDVPVRLRDLIAGKMEKSGVPPLQTAKSPDLACFIKVECGIPLLVTTNHIPGSSRNISITVPHVFG
jgi:hypothetical protein